MNKKTGQQNEATDDGKERPGGDPSNITEMDISETDTQSGAGLSGRIMAFLQRIELDDEQTPIYYLSKYEHSGSGETKAFVGKFEDCEPPDEALIGQRYGAGRYILTCQIPPLPGKKEFSARVYKFRVSSAFDRHRDASTPAAIPAAIPAGMISPEAGMMQAFSILERFVSLIMPMFNRPRDENVLGILNQNYQSVNDLMKKQMQDNMKMLTDYQRTIADLGNGETMETTATEERPEPPSIIEQFGPLIQQWIPVLLGGGPKAAAAGALVQQVPQVQQVLKDKLQLRKIIMYLDQSQGPDRTDKILAALKIQRSGKRPVQVQQVPQVEPKGKRRAPA